jgi:hypothetical protein
MIKMKYDLWYKLKYIVYASYTLVGFIILFFIARLMKKKEATIIIDESIKVDVEKEINKEKNDSFKKIEVIKKDTAEALEKLEEVKPQDGKTINNMLKILGDKLNK